MNFNPAAAVSVLINHNHHLNSNSINGGIGINHNNNNSISINNNNNNNNNNSNNNNNNNSDSENYIQFDSPLTPATANHLKSMEWTNDDALELIEQYRCHTELWNRGDPKYKDKLCRFRAWSEIAERFGCSKAEVERKMNVLLTQYRREKHKMLVKLYQGIQPSPSKWYAFKRFDFMEAGSIAGALAGSSSGSGSGSASGGGNASSAMRTRGETSAMSGSTGVSVGGNGVVVDAVGIGSGTNGHTIAAAALNELRNFEATSAVAAAAAAASSCSSATSATAASATTHHQQQQQHHHHHHQHTHHHPQAHRQRFKTKEMKYFGAMGLNLPMLIANTQTLDSWNSVGQFSPPIGGVGGASGSGERVSHLRVPLPLPFGGAPAPVTELGAASTTSGRSMFGCGGSSSSDHTASPQKPMETTEIDIDERDVKHEQHESVGVGGGESGDQSLQHLHQQSDAGGTSIDNPGGGGGGGVDAAAIGLDKCESETSPLPNPTNTHEAHISSRQPQYPLQRHHQHLHHDPRSDQEDVDIKEELIDYFHAPNPPAPPGSHRSYSSNEERLGGIGGSGGAGTDSDDFAQDLRISAAVAAAAKGLDFRRFVLPRNLRRSTDSNDEEKYTPLNMRKLSNASAAGSTGGIAPNSAAAAVTSAGQMLMSTLLSHESLSNDTTASGRGAGGVKSEASTSAAAAAAALYAESLNRDDCDFIGSNVSLKLRAMDRDQRIIAEKLISEVLYFGQFNELERSARIQPK